MNIATHILFWGDFVDPVIWLRVLRMVIFAICAILMYSEPMLCGGRNRFFHRLLALQFVVASIFTWGIAKARMEILVRTPEVLVSADLLMFEIAYSASTIALLLKLSYDVIKWKQYQKIKMQPDKCDSCHAKFTP